MTQRQPPVTISISYRSKMTRSSEKETSDCWSVRNSSTNHGQASSFSLFRVNTDGHSPSFTSATVTLSSLENSTHSCVCLPISWAQNHCLSSDRWTIPPRQTCPADIQAPGNDESKGLAFEAHPSMDSLPCQNSVSSQHRLWYPNLARHTNLKLPARPLNAEPFVTRE
jgi:hypothetical protein